MAVSVEGVVHKLYINEKNQLEMGIDPRIADLRSGSATGTGTTTPDLDRAEAEENGDGEGDEGDEAEGWF